MSIAGVCSWQETALRTINGKAMTVPFHAIRFPTVACAICLLVTGCSTKPVMGTGTPELRAQAAQLVRDREFELATLRAEMAATRIAAAKKEAELQELRDLVQQLRQETADARQLVVDLREQAEQHRHELDRARSEQERQAASHTNQHLTVLKDTMATLANEVGQLRQELARPVVKERGKPSKGMGGKSGEVGRAGDLPDSLQRLPSATDRPAASPVTPGTFKPVSTLSQPQRPVSITVQPGETLWGLAKRHHTSVAALREQNHIEGEALAVGQVLLLPQPQPLVRHP